MTALFDPTATPTLTPVPVNLRDACLRPMDVRLILSPGALVCPHDDVLLLQRLGGWYCPTCLGGWDAEGRCGRWLPIRDPALRTATRRRLRLLADTDGPEGQARAGTTDVRRSANPQIRNCQARADTADDHAADDNAAGWLRRLDRRYALAVGIVAAAGFGYVAGRLSPWAELVPDAVVWAAAGGVLAAAVTAAGAVAVWRWWAGWWPYRFNRVLGADAAELGWEIPAGGEVRDGR